MLYCIKMQGLRAGGNIVTAPRPSAAGPGVGMELLLVHLCTTDFNITLANK